jgi:hypothetical protein
MSVPGIVLRTLPPVMIPAEAAMTAHRPNSFELLALDHQP